MRRTIAAILIIFLTATCGLSAQQRSKQMVAFYTGKEDAAHISFVHEANKKLYAYAVKSGYNYDSTNNWDNLNAVFLSKYQLVIFLDSRPEAPIQRVAFEKYMKEGGAWIGFHFSAFTLNDSKYPENWPWYHEIFLGSGEYVSNTWQPTAAHLKVEGAGHRVVSGISSVFVSSPNEWYRWKNDLRKNPDIQILVSIDSSSFPLGTGPKPNEIWHDGYYPVVWANKKYWMVYFNMGHNDIDYEHGTKQTLSNTFGNAMQDKMTFNAIDWLMRKRD